MRQQVADIAIQRGRQSRQDIGEPGMGIVLIGLGGGKQTHDRRRAHARGVRTGESSQPRGISPLGCSRNRT